MPFAISRSLNFWILPVLVFGTSREHHVARHLVAGEVGGTQCAMILGGVALAPGFSSTKAQGVSPHLSSGFATTAAACTAGCL